MQTKPDSVHFAQVNSGDLLLSVVIINYRTPGLVVDCLSSLLPELSGLDAKVVVVDNLSGDDSLSVIKGWLETGDPDHRVTVLPAPTNAGFSSGNNIGVRAEPAQYHLLLNSDTLVRPGAIAALLETAQQHPGFGLFSPRLEWPDGRGQESCFRFHTPISEFLGAAQTGLLDRWLKKFLVPMPVQTQLAQPEWTSFACVLIRRQVFEQIGLMDEGYFLYFEDVAFCHAARQAGWMVLHNPQARVVHLRGGTSTVKSSTLLKKRLPRYYYESRTRFFYYGYGYSGLLAANLLWWCGHAVAKARQWLGRADKTAVDRQWRDIWTNWMHPMQPYSLPKT